MADLRLQAYVEVWICVLVRATIFILLVSKDFLGNGYILDGPPNSD